MSKNLEIKIHRNIILSVVLYVCKTWYLTLRKEYRLRMSENRVLKIFRPKGEKVGGGWGRSHGDFLTCTLHYVLLG
jgi:hypothetical protein